MKGPRFVLTVVTTR